MPNGSYFLLWPILEFFLCQFAVNLAMRCDLGKGKTGAPKAVQCCLQ